MMYRAYVINWQKFILLGLKLIVITFIKQLLNHYYKTLVTYAASVTYAAIYIAMLFVSGYKT